MPQTRRQRDEVVDVGPRHVHSIAELEELSDTTITSNMVRVVTDWGGVIDEINGLDRVILWRAKDRVHLKPFIELRTASDTIGFCHRDCTVSSTEPRHQLMGYDSMSMYRVNEDARLCGFDANTISCCKFEHLVQYGESFSRAHVDYGRNAGALAVTRPCMKAFIFAGRVKKFTSHSRLFNYDISFEEAMEIVTSPATPADVYLVLMVPGDMLFMPVGHIHLVKTFYMPNTPLSERWSYIGGHVFCFKQDIQALITAENSRLNCTRRGESDIDGVYELVRPFSNTPYPAALELFRIQTKNKRRIGNQADAHLQNTRKWMATMYTIVKNIRAEIDNEMTKQIRSADTKRKETMKKKDRYARLRKLKAKKNTQ
jgi:hypothetical protein